MKNPTKQTQDMFFMVATYFLFTMWAIVSFVAVIFLLLIAGE